MNSGGHKQIEILIYIIFIILVTTLSALFSQYFQKNEDDANKEQGKIEATAPLINTAELPNAKVGAPYRAVVFSSIFINTKLTISVTGLPNGLSLTDCTNEKDVNAVPKKPNTLAKCLITGTPTKAGSYKVELNINAEDSHVNTIGNLTLVVE